MQLLVTGGAGFIGSHLVDALIERGHEVTVIDNFSTGRNINQRANYIEASIQDSSQFPFTQKFDAVFHLAALARIQPSITTPLPFDLNNVHGTVAALEIARQHGAKFIFSSSSSIYGPQDGISKEEDIPNPQNPYALQKHIGEQYVQMYEKLYGLRATVFRYFNVFGERQLAEGAYATVIGIFDKQIERGEPLTIVSDGEQRRDFTYVKDIVRANLIALENPDTDGFTINVGTGKNVSVNEVADTMAPSHPREIGIERVGEVRQTLADNSRMRSFGWEPTMDILTWLRNRHEV